MNQGPASGRNNWRRGAGAAQSPGHNREYGTGSELHQRSARWLGKGPYGRAAWWVGLGALVVGGGVGGGATGDELPPQLRCLERYYGVGSAVKNGAYFAVVPGGRPVPFDDRRTKTADERLNDPDVKDLFAQHYPVGPIAAVTTPDFDPGRVRLDALFQARYGAPPAHVTVVPFELFGSRLRVNQLVLPAFTRVRTRLEALVAKEPALRDFFVGLGGTFVVRNIAGTSRRSAHSYGVSLDVNVKRSHYWRWQKPANPLHWRNQIPQNIVDAFEAEGFIWGGRWYHYDTMHFEYRPELLDASCYG